MIEYKQVGDNTPKDVQITTDDANAELAIFQDAYDNATNMNEEFESSCAFSTASADTDGLYTWTVPGHEFGDLASMVDHGALDPHPEDWLEKC